MVSAAEQLVSNINFNTFLKAKELRQRLFFTFIALLVYRAGTYIPLPGINPEAFGQAFQNQTGGLLSTLNLFAGGAIERMAIFALNIMPYITASIIMQLMASTVPQLMELKKEGESGRRQINQYTRYLTVIFASVQGFFLAMSLQQSSGGGLAVVANPGPFFVLSTTVTIVGGVMFLLWLGEQITARGVGNGVSLIIFAGIVAELPRVAISFLDQGRAGTVSFTLILAVLIGAILLIAFIAFMERSQRRLLVQYPRRQMGNQMFEGDKSHLPLKVNPAGVIPPIFASSILLLPATIAGISGNSSSDFLNELVRLFSPGQLPYILLYAVAIIGFTFLYTPLIFNTEETAENLRKNGGYIQGYRPGQRTAAYLSYILNRITFVGAMYLTFVCVLPEVMRSQFTNIPIAIGGTSLLIVVSVTIDTVAQIQGHLISAQYDSLLKRSKLRGKQRTRRLR